mmetsp:Transcript_1647/g.4802  ORF Transcript_1647/g.4802 Transcript_1647/m.4802 type:complete len:221 (+) Transcript_1647:272-934(+)
MPPATTRVSAVIYDASSDARNATAAAMSNGVPSRPSSVASSFARLASGVPVSAEAKLVGTNPGATQFTRMPSPPNSCANAFVRPTTAVLEMAYMAKGCMGLKAEKELLYTIEPPLVMCFTASRVSQIADCTLICKIFSMALSSMAKMGPPAGLTAALLTRMSMCCLPKVLRAASTSALTWSSFPTWHATPRTSKSSPLSRFTVSSTLACFLDEIITQAPS